MLRRAAGPGESSASASLSMYGRVWPGAPDSRRQSGKACGPFAAGGAAAGSAGTRHGEALPEDHEGERTLVGYRRNQVAAEALPGSRNHQRLLLGTVGASGGMIRTETPRVTPEELCPLAIRVSLELREHSSFNRRCGARSAPRTDARPAPRSRAACPGNSWVPDPSGRPCGCAASDRASKDSMPGNLQDP